MKQTDTYIKCEYIADKWLGSALNHVAVTIKQAGSLMPYDDELFLSNLMLFIEAANFVIKNNIDVKPLEDKAEEFLAYAQKCNKLEQKDAKAELNGLLGKMGV